MDAPLLASPPHEVNSNQCAVLKDAHLIGERMDVHQLDARRARDAIGIAADANYAIAGDVALQLEDRAEVSQRQRTQMRALFGEASLTTCNVVA